MAHTFFTFSLSLLPSLPPRILFSVYENVHNFFYDFNQIAVDWAISLVSELNICIFFGHKCRTGVGHWNTRADPTSVKWVVFNEIGAWRTPMRIFPQEWFFLVVGGRNELVNWWWPSFADQRSGCKSSSVDTDKAELGCFRRGRGRGEHAACDRFVCGARFRFVRVLHGPGNPYIHEGLVEIILRLPRAESYIEYCKGEEGGGSMEFIKFMNLDECGNSVCFMEAVFFGGSIAWCEAFCHVRELKVGEENWVVYYIFWEILILN